MAGSTPPDDQSSRRPAAVMVGGQRRRLVRRSGASRLQSAATLGREPTNPNPSTSTNTIRATVYPERKDSASATYKYKENQKAQPSLPDFDSASKYHAPSGFHRPTKPCPYGGTDVSLMSIASGTVTEDKKSHGRFEGLKSKERDHTITSPTSILPTSPLPPLTPSKAAQFLGLPTNIPTVSSSRKSDDDNQDLGFDDGALVGRTLKQQLSVPLLTKIKGAAAKYNIFKEAAGEPDPLRKNTQISGSDNKKALKKLGFLPLRAQYSKSTPNLAKDAAADPMPSLPQVTNHGYRDDFHLLGRPTGLKPVFESPTRRTRKKQPKTLHRMSPITETSHDELRTAYRNSEHASELEVISEYEQDNSQSNVPSYPISRHAFTLATNIKYELADEDLSPMDEHEEETTIKGKLSNEYQGPQFTFRKKKWHGPTVVPKRGPLQKVEDHLQSLAAKNLEEHERVKRLDASKLETDAEVAALRAEHEQMKKDFKEMKKRHAIQDELWRQHQCNPNHHHHHNGNHHVHMRSDDSESDEDDDDLVSLRSSIDLDEEPTVHEARVVTFTRITPGMVKLVDIPPRKKKPLPSGSPAPSEALPVRIKPTGNGASKTEHGEIKPNTAHLGSFFKHEQKPKAFTGRTENLQPNISRPEPEDFDFPRHTIPRKAKMPRSESRLLVEDWITKSPAPNKCRPVSERLDIDVLADQQIPPAPFPKERDQE